MDSIEEPVDEQNELWRSGQRVPIESLVGKHSIRDSKVITDLIYNEVLLRESLGEAPELEEYTDRFPQLSDELKRQFQFHRALGSPTQDTEAGGDTPINEPSVVADPGRIQIPGFKLLDVVGKGGSAVAWRAKDLSLNREVVIKLLSVVQTAKDPEEDQLLSEARAAASLNHPSIVQVYQVGKADGVPFLVMEYLSGGSLANRLVNGPMLPDEAAAMGVEISKAVHYAHGQGIIHRDLKPANILLDESGKPRVADFGLARQLDPNITRQSTRVVGTPAFMPPEQARGKPANALADVYSIGATLYAMLTGRPPFQTASVWDTLFQVMQNDAVPARQLNDRIPKDLETVCAKCLEKNPDRRYSSADELAADLQRFLENKPIEARPVTRFESLLRWCSRNRALAGSLLTVAALVTTLAIGGVLSALHFQNQNRKLSIAVRNSIDAADELLVSVTEDARLLPKSPGSQQISKRLLERARTYYVSFLNDNQGDPDLAFQLARTHAGLARVAAAMEEPEVLALETTAALDLLDEVEANNDMSFETQSLRGGILRVQGQSLHAELKSAEAVEWMERSVSALQTAFDLNPESNDSLLKLARAKADLGAVLQKLGDVKKAETVFTESREQLAHVMEADPNLTEAVLYSGKVESNLASLKRAQSTELFDQHLNQAIELLESLPEDERASIDVRSALAKCYTNKGSGLAHSGKLTEAADAFEIAISESKRLVELEPSINRHKRNYVIAVLNSGFVDSFSDNNERLASRVQDVLPVANELIDEAPDNLSNLELKVMLLGNLSVALTNLDRLEEALDAVDQSIETAERLSTGTEGTPESLERIALSQYQRARTLIKLERIDEAIAAVEASRDATRKGLEVDPDFLPLVIHDIDLFVLQIEALAEKEAKPLEQIMGIAQQGLEKAETLRGKHSDSYLEIAFGNLLMILAESNAEIGNRDNAVEFANRAISEFQVDGKPSEVADLNEILIDAHLLIAKLIQQRKGTPDEEDSDVQKIEDAFDAAKALGATDEQLSEFENE